MKRSLVPSRCRAFSWLLIAAISLGFTSLSLRAELEFDSTHASYEAKPDEEAFTTTFTFTNTGSRPVIIQRVDSNCGCIRAQADKDRYAPGEQGTISATFKIGSTEGLQTKNITVLAAEETTVVPPKIVGKPEVASPSDASSQPAQTAAGPPTTHRLTVELKVPVLIDIEPKITKWEVGAPPETQTIRLTMHHQDPIHIQDVRSSRDNVRVETKVIQKGKIYELQLTPESTASVQLGMLTIETDCSLPNHQKKLAFFSIHRPTPARPATGPAEAAEAPAPPADNPADPSSS